MIVEPRPASREVRPLVQAARHALAALYVERLAGLHVYGSYARGEATERSDLDLLVVLRGAFDRAEEAWRLADVVLDFAQAHGVSLQTILMTEADFAQAHWPLLANVRREAVPVLS